MSNARAILEEITRESLAELLAGYGRGSATPHAVDVAQPSVDAIAATLGFVAEGLRGSVVLVAQPGDLATVLPPELRSGGLTDEVLADWTGELANQLVGRVKNKLLRYGVAVTLSVPSVFSASHLRLHPRRHSMPAANHIELRTAVDGFDATFDVEIQAGVELTVRASVAAPPSEGELVLF